MYKLNRLIISNDLEVTLVKKNRFLFRKHFHNSFTIGYIIAGERGIEKSTDKRIIKKGEIYVINPGEMHRCLPANDSECSYLIINIGKDNYRNLIKEHYVNKSIKEVRINRLLIHNDKIKNTFNSLVHLSFEDQNKQKIKNITVQILLRIFFFYGSANQESGISDNLLDAVEKAKRFIEKNYLNNISLDDISSESGLSKYHLSRHFYKKIGLSPHEYLVQLRIKNSGKMLDNGNTLSEIAYENSFTDQSYFTRVFKKYNGITPGEFTSAGNQ